jgi:hypothetical protein
VFKSTNSATSWTQVGPAASIGRFAINPANTQMIYATVLLDGVYRSLDGGSSWSAFSLGLDSVAAIPLAIHPVNPSRLYTGTFGHGIFASQ